jgi:nucleoside-diphosphate-sugar epimerase
MKTILLTGATGFLGSHLLERLLEENYTIIVLKRSFSNISRIEKLLNDSKVISYNIDIIQLEKIFIENNIETIIHCATNYGRNNKSCYKVLETNLMFPIMLLEFAVKYKVKTFINTDSYFNKDNNSYSFLLDYSLSKKSLNLWLKYFSNKIQIINMLLEHIYGENDSIDKFVESTIQEVAIVQVKKIDLTLGYQKRDFIYIKDVVNAYIQILTWSEKHKFKFENFDIGTGVTTSIKDFVKEIKKISKSNTLLNFGELPYRKDEIMYSVADNSKLLNIGWEYKYNIHDGINNIIKAKQGKAIVKR